MLANAFVGQGAPPSEEQTASELGVAEKLLWDEIVSVVSDEYGVASHEWYSYSTKAGWSLRLKRGSRTILYLVPSHRTFSAAFVLGDKAVKAAHDCGLPKRIVRIIESSRRYAEGTGVRFEVHGPEDVEAVKKLTSVKIAN